MLAINNLDLYLAPRVNLKEYNRAENINSIKMWENMQPQLFYLPEYEKEVDVLYLYTFKNEIFEMRSFCYSAYIAVNCIAFFLENPHHLIPHQSSGSSLMDRVDYRDKLQSTIQELFRDQKIFDQAFEKKILLCTYPSRACLYEDRHFQLYHQYLNLTLIGENRATYVDLDYPLLSSYYHFNFYICQLIYSGFFRIRELLKKPVYTSAPLSLPAIWPYPSTSVCPSNIRKGE